MEVTSVSNNKNIHKAILASAFGDAGSSPLPDMFVAYPKTVLAMPDDTILVDYRDYFSKQEISEFVDTFVEEGMRKTLPGLYKRRKNGYAKRSRYLHSQIDQAAQRSVRHFFKVADGQ